MYNARCTILTSDDRRCSSFVFPGHSTLCHYHLRQQLDSIQNFQSATAVNAALGKILAMLAAGRIKRQDAIAMAYICQLMLQSLKGFKHEILLTTYEKIWERDLLKVLNARTPLQDFAFPPQVEEEVQQEQEQEQEQAPQTPAPQSTQQPQAPSPAPEPHSTPAQVTASDGALADTEAAEEENQQEGNQYNYWQEIRQHEQHEQAPQENYNEDKEEPQKVQT